MIAGKQKIKSDIYFYRDHCTHMCVVKVQSGLASQLT